MMADDPDKLASPACSLDEANDVYRGYLTPAELQQVIASWQSAAPSPNIGVALAALLSQSRPVDAATATVPIRLSAKQLQHAINAILPKIRDDKTHQALQDIASKL